MADYYAILKRAISALPEPTGEARRAVYEKARTALVAQLKSFDPPLSASDITQQRLQLEDAIRKVESEAAKGLLSQALNRAAIPERSPTAPTGQPSPAPAPARVAAPQPVPAQLAPQAPVAPTASTAPFAAPQPERTPTGPTGFARPDREPIGQTVAQPRPPLTSAEPTSATRPPLARPQFEPATRQPQAFEPPTGSRPLAAAPSQSAARQAPAAQPPVFTRERMPTGTVAAPPLDMPPVPPVYSEQEDVTQPVANRAFRTAVKDMDRLGTAAHDSARRARDALNATDLPPSGDAGLASDGGRKGRRPLTAQSKAGSDASTPPPLNAPIVVPRKTSRTPVVVGLLVVVVIVLGGGGLYWKRDDIASYLGAAKPALDLVQRSSSEKPFVKSQDRLTADDNGQKSAQAPGVKVVTTQPITPGSDQPPAAGATTQPTTQAPAAPAATSAPQPQPSGSTAQAPAPLPMPDALPIAQKATLLEEPADNNSAPVQTEGKVIWSLQKTPSPQAGKPDIVHLQGRVDIPGRGLTLQMTLDQNTDANLPASHIIKLEFKTPPDFDNRNIADVKGVILKQSQDARGDQLLGATAKITNNIFWIALDSANASLVRNVQLIKERGWISIAFVYGTNKRAMLTLEKAGAGDRIFNDALTAWGN